MQVADLVRKEYARIIGDLSYHVDNMSYQPPRGARCAALPRLRAFQLALRTHLYPAFAAEWVDIDRSVVVQLSRIDELLDEALVYERRHKRSSFSVLDRLRHALLTFMNERHIRLCATMQVLFDEPERRQLGGQMLLELRSHRKPSPWAPWSVKARDAWNRLRPTFLARRPMRMVPTLNDVVPG